jgi:uncharacterized Fe-S center protein
MLKSHVSDGDIRKYEMFSQKLQEERGFGGTFKFSDASGAAPAAAAMQQRLRQMMTISTIKCKDSSFLVGCEGMLKKDD